VRRAVPAAGSPDNLAQTIRGAFWHGQGLGGHNNYRAAEDALAALLSLLAERERERDEARKWANTMEHERDWEQQVVHSDLLDRAESAERERGELEVERDALERADKLLRAYRDDLHEALAKAGARAEKAEAALDEARRHLTFRENEFYKAISVGGDVSAELKEAERQTAPLREALVEIEQATLDGKSLGHIGYLARVALAVGEHEQGDGKSGESTSG
jgi:vacuolar-type H+-ATPase subunit I/STV1